MTRGPRLYSRAVSARRKTIAIRISRRVLIVITLAMIAGTIGCAKKNPPAPTPAPPPQAKQKTETEAAKPPADTPSEADAEKKPATDETKADNSTPDKPADESTAEKPTEPPPARIEIRPERFAILTPGGPLIVDVTISLDGKSPSDLFAGRIQQVLDAADTDHDKRSTWTELAANEEFMKAERVTNPATAKARTKAWSEQYDINRDKLIQSNEAASWLGREYGRSVTALALRSRRSYYSSPSLGSRIWQVLDVDSDGRLSAEEIAAAPDRFLSLDANDDRIITTAELAPLREQLNDATRPPATIGRNEDRYAALQLTPPGNLERVEYLLADLYAPRQPLSPSSFPDLPQLFGQIDADANGRIAQEELAKLLTIKPQAELAITFEKAAQDGQRGVTRVEVRAHEPEITRLIQPAANRAVFSLGNTRLTVSAHDVAGGAMGPPGMYVERDALRVMVHDDFDAVFEQLDADSDGRLGEREIATSPTRILTRDKNGDGQISGDELPSAMIVAFLRSEPANQQTFYVPASDGNTPRSTGNAPPWFAQADFNGDGDVSRREFLGSVEQFTKIDVNHDEFISSNEASQIDTTK